ncbi:MULTISPECIES: hypothetical protein [Streptomycetaceae]|uniref:hypothetical protein n=1 Tax=Streptomycetaceae TaxID=2062 RepID=UPI00131A1155|nr:MULTISPECIES: hypothetical protein [Streptomycetaceae]MYX36034.1 hypothetical protein [Streptomyces sp. SID8377]
MPEVAEVVVLYALLTVAGAAAVALARSALRHWWEQRAGRVYELPVERAGTVLRGAGSALAAAVAITLGVCLPPGPGSPSLSPHRQVTAAGPPSSPRPRPVPSDPADAGLVPPRTLGHPAGGTLHELSDGTRVWLPPQYDYPDSAGLYFPLVVAHIDPADPDLFAGFAAQSLRGLADPFVVVLPARCDDGPGARPASVPAAVARLYRVLPGRPARALLGADGDADCVVRQQLTDPRGFATAIGVSGGYEEIDRSGPPPYFSADGRYAGRDMPRPALLLAVPSGEENARRSALALRGRVRGVSAEVRVLDGIAPRRRLFALVAGYATEKLDSPDRP